MEVDYDLAGIHTRKETEAAYGTLSEEPHSGRAEPDGVSRREKTVVAGHRNPDTDSICSAIAYARLKNEVDPAREYIPYRLGRVNDETSYVLKRFGMPEPNLLEDIKARVEDAPYRRTPAIPADTSLREAWSLIRKRSVVSLPVTEGAHEGAGGKLAGLVTVKDIGKVYLDDMSASLLSQARTPVRNLMRVLDGRLVAGSADAVESGVLTHGEVMIAAAAETEQFAEYVHPGDIVIVANRGELQRAAIREGAGCLVVTLGSFVSDDICEYANERGCIVISTEYGTFATARLINQSIPVSFVMTAAENIISFTPKTYISDVKKVMAKNRYRDFPVLGDDGGYLGMISRRFLLDTPRRNIILVDHNEKEQSAFGIEEARILEIVDHHRLAPVETVDPVSFRNQPCGSTATIIYEIYREKGIVPDETTAGLLCAAVISDTLLFRSPSTTHADRLAGAALANIAGLDIDAFATEMFLAGAVSTTDITGNPLDLLIRDFKTYKVDGKDFGIGQINFQNKESLAGVSENLMDVLAEARAAKRVDVIYVLLTDISESDSYVIFDGDGAAELLETAFRKIPEEGRLFLKDVVSRKKQFVPEIFQALK